MREKHALDCGGHSPFLPGGGAQNALRGGDLLLNYKLCLSLLARLELVGGAALARPLGLRIYAYLNRLVLYRVS